MKKFLSIVVGIAGIILTGCGQTPNSVSMTVTPGQCAISSYYSKSVTPPTQIANNTTKPSPNCVAVTIQNNNSGNNANNIQITSGGVNLTYSVGTTAYSNSLYDPIAATVTMSGAQNLGDIWIFDPRNCATTQGVNVISIGSGGQTCTFYLQIVPPAFAIGIYPSTLTYNYTNGNQNYSVSASFNQRISFFAGGNSGIYTASSNQWQPKLPDGEANSWNPINAMVTDIYGNVYFATNNAVYLFNGINPVSQVGANFSTTINALATDNYGNAYAGTTNGVFEFNTTSNTWSIFPSTQNLNINGLTSHPVNSTTTNSLLYATTNTPTPNAYSCQMSSNTFLGCTFTQTNQINLPVAFNDNSITTDNLGNLYAGTFNQLSFYSNSNWTNANINGILSGTISTTTFESASGNSFLFFGENNAFLTNESAVYSCVSANLISPSCTSFNGSTGNSIVGNVFSTTLDPANNLYAVGGNLYSNDFGSASGPYSGAFVGTSVTGASAVSPSTQWVPITGSIINGLKNSTTNAALTLY